MPIASARPPPQAKNHVSFMPEHHNSTFAHAGNRPAIQVAQHRVLVVSMSTARRGSSRTWAGPSGHDGRLHVIPS